MRIPSLALAPVLLAALLFAGTGPALATTLKEKPVACPVCTKPFTALEVGSTNTFGGYDSDLCVHANGTPPSSFAVWTCPSCRYSARSARFAKGVSEATKAKILKGWPAAPKGFPDGGSQRDIPAWQKYEFAGRILEEEKAKDSDRLLLWRDAAFAERCASEEALEAVREDPVLGPRFSAARNRVHDLCREAPSAVDGCRTESGTEIQAARAVLEEAGKAAPAERRVMELAASSFLRGRGEFRVSAAALRGVADAKEEKPPVRDAALALLASIERERAFLERSTSIVRLSGEALPKLVLDDEPAARGGWTIAESFRRLGSDEQAEGWVRAVLGSRAARDWMFLLAREVLAVEGAGGPRWTAAARAGCGAWEKRLFERLRDPEAGEEAAAVLGRLGDAAHVPALLEALKAADTAAAPFAAVALGGYAEPGEAVEKALSGILADGDADPELRWRAAEALLALSPESARPAFLAAAQGDSLVREAALRGLGRVGEADAAPVLLAAAKEDPKVALPALSLLAARDLPTLEAATAWWESNRKRTRAEWTGEAFRGAGADLPAIPDRASVPRLVDLLGEASLPVRWAAFRALRALSGRSLGRVEILDEGRVLGATKPVVPFTVEEVFGEGRVVMTGPLPDNDIGEMLGRMAPSMKEDNARPSWERAQALWRRWWREQGGR